jgi:hypothetical protein
MGVKQNGDETKIKIKAKNKQTNKENKQASKQTTSSSHGFYFYYFFIITSSSPIRLLLHLLATSDEANFAMTRHPCCIPLLLL